MASQKSEPIVNSTDLPYTPIDQIPSLYDQVTKAHSVGLSCSFLWRSHQLKQLSYMLQDNTGLIEEALAIDLGRPIRESHLAELNGIRSEVIEAINNLQKWMKPQSVKTQLSWMIARPKVYHEPKGVVLIFGTWNYPVHLLLAPVIGAIAGGNSMIIKPSENCPTVSGLLTKLLERYMDTNNIVVVNGDHEHCTKLLEFKFDHIFFTGSLTIAKTIAKSAAENMTPTTLELGGKCPAIVFDDANFTVAARRLLWAKVVNAGQTCLAPDYILVPKKCESKLIDAIRSAYKEFYLEQSQLASSSSAKESTYCKIINERQFNRLKQYLKDTKGEPVPIAPNGELLQPDLDTLKFPLTLIRNVTTEDTLMQEEIFGPILPIITYDSDHESLSGTLNYVNRSTPLAAYVFSQNQKNIEYVRNHTKSGQLVCNDLLIQFAVAGLPFGGVGSSGFGNYHGYHSFLTFSYERSFLDVPYWADILIKVRYPPYTGLKFKLSKLLVGPPTLNGRSNPRPAFLSLNQSHDDFKKLLLNNGGGGLCGLLKRSRLAQAFVLMIFYIIQQNKARLYNLFLGKN